MVRIFCLSLHCQIKNIVSYENQQQRKQVTAQGAVP